MRSRRGALAEEQDGWDGADESGAGWPAKCRAKARGSGIGGGGRDEFHEWTRIEGSKSGRRLRKRVESGLPLCKAGVDGARTAGVSREDREGCEGE